MTLPFYSSVVESTPFPKGPPKSSVGGTPRWTSSSARLASFRSRPGEEEEGEEEGEETRLQSFGLLVLFLL